MKRTHNFKQELIDCINKVVKGSNFARWLPNHKSFLVFKEREAFLMDDSFHFIRTELGYEFVSIDLSKLNIFNYIDSFEDAEEYLNDLKNFLLKFVFYFPSRLWHSIDISNSLENIMSLKQSNTLYKLMLGYDPDTIWNVKRSRLFLPKYNMYIVVLKANRGELNQTKAILNSANVFEITFSLNEKEDLSPIANYLFLSNSISGESIYLDTSSNFDWKSPIYDLQREQLAKIIDRPINDIFLGTTGLEAVFNEKAYSYYHFKEGYFVIDKHFCYYSTSREEVIQVIKDECVPETKSIKSLKTHFRKLLRLK